MRLQSAVLAAIFALSLAACGDDDGARPTGPVTLKFRTSVFPDIEGTANDTVKGMIIVDGTDTLQLPYDSIVNFPRGQHTFEARLNVDYLPSVFTEDINPSGTTAIVEIAPAGTCRVYQANGVGIDAVFCAPQGAPPRNVLYWSQRRRIFCPAGDFMEFCTPNPSRDGLGLTWPIDNANSASNEYVSQAKLLVAATVGNEVGGTDAGRNIAMALYRVGDYSPRRRLQVVQGDSSRYSSIAWTDVRHVPVYNFPRGQLNPSDRLNALFGLEVKATYLLPQQYQDVLIVRYDVRNISADEDYRRVHPTSPAAGFTLRNVYLTPVIDADVGGAFQGEADDDAGTIFPAEGLAAAWDRDLAVGYWTIPYNTGPGLVGLKVLNTDAGTPKGVVFGTDTLDYFTTAREAEAYAYLTAGRGATITGCTSYTDAYVCGGEAAQDVRIGWSVGPVATLAPGESRTLTVAILLAAPSTGTFTSGTSVLPGNNSAAELASTTKNSYRLAGALRDLAATIAGVTVTPAP
jgi:hypothetical protein